MVSRAKSKWDKLDDRVKKWASRLTAIATIIGVLAAGGGVIINQLDNAVAARIEAQTVSLEKEVEELTAATNKADKEIELQLMRLELMMLMQNDPTNTVEIEKVAHDYFAKGGNYYLDSEYNKWCHSFGGDCELMFK